MTMKQLSAAHRYCLTSLARGNMVLVQMILFRKPWRCVGNKAYTLALSTGHVLIITQQQCLEQHRLWQARWMALRYWTSLMVRLER